MEDFMKKSVWRQMGIVLLAVSTLFLGACKQEASPERASNIDIYTMDAIDITAKAYPGFIYVAWGDTIYDEGNYQIYRNDGKRISSNNGDNSYIDSDIKDGIDKSIKIFKTIDFEDKDHAKTISDAMQSESKKLGGKK